MFQYIKV